MVCDIDEPGEASVKWDGLGAYLEHHRPIKRGNTTHGNISARDEPKRCEILQTIGIFVTPHAYDSGAGTQPDIGQTGTGMMGYSAINGRNRRAVRIGGGVPE